VLTRRGGAVSARHLDVRTGSRRAQGWFVADQADSRKRSIWLLLACAAMAVTLAGRLVDVQIRQGGTLAAQAAADHQLQITVQGHRGRIFDASGNVLASDVPVYDVYADPGEIADTDRAGVAAQLAPVLQMSDSKVGDLLNAPGKRFVYLAKGVDQSTKDRLDRLNLLGIGTIERDKRVYNPSPLPGASFAEPMLGFVDGDGNGQYGVEQYYNTVLRGSDGHVSTLRDDQGNPIVLSQEAALDPRNGSDLQLGVDSRIQYWAEQALAQGVSNAGASSGEVMVMDVHTGAIRAWAQYPSYDANSYQSSDLGTFRDQSVADLYEPGSTMKVITFAGGLDHGAITPATTMNEGPVTIGGYTIHDWDHKAHGNVTMQQVLDQSLNDGAIKVMQLMGEDAYYRNLLAFGIGSPTGIDVAGEQTSPLRPQSEWGPADYATAAFGQGVEVTPVEMLAGINAVANGGVWVQPHMVERVIDPITGKATPFVPSSRRVISTQAAGTLTTMMTGVVDHADGEGFLARIPGFTGQIAGKTGTADEPTNGAYNGALIVSFAGFMPVSNPQFTMLVVLRYPTENRIPRFGAFLAAPVWKQIAQVIVDQWRIVP
jgi:stage V sporulation protein D (sporulation-specific penicillin-binding protein)